jgi:hypothetical protein
MKKALVLRWIALGLATLAGLWWLVTLVGHLVSGPDPYAVEDAALEGTALTILVGACLIGVGLAWWRARLGGGVLAVAGAALCVFAWITAGQNKAVAVLVSGAPFLVSGVMLLASRRRREEA